MERRLAAILALDVVGYSRLMGEDEAGTLAQLKSHRKELIDPMTSEYGDQVVKLMGDSMLMEFGSVDDAVRFAVEVRRAMGGRNAEVHQAAKLSERAGPAQVLEVS